MLSCLVISNFYISLDIFYYLSYLVGSIIHIEYSIWICQFYFSRLLFSTKTLLTKFVVAPKSTKALVCTFTVYPKCNWSFISRRFSCCTYHYKTPVLLSKIFELIEGTLSSNYRLQTLSSTVLMENPSWDSSFPSSLEC